MATYTCIVVLTTHPVAKGSTHTHTHTTHTHTHTHAHTQTHTNTHITRTHARTHTHTHIYTHKHTHHTHTHTPTNTYTQTHTTRTHTHTHHTHTHTYTHTHTHTWLWRRQFHAMSALTLDQGAFFKARIILHIIFLLFLLFIIISIELPLHRIAEWTKRRGPLKCWWPWPTDLIQWTNLVWWPWFSLKLTFEWNHVRCGRIPATWGGFT